MEIYFPKPPPPTAGDDDGAPYTDYSFALPADDTYYWIYIGAEDPQKDTLQLFENCGIFVVNLILFGYFDANGNGTYEASIDTAPYSQNVPFQGMKILPQSPPCGG